MIYIYFSKGISHIYVEEYPKSVSIGNIRGGIYMFLMRFRHLSKNNCFFWRKFLGNPLLLIYVILSILYYPMFLLVWYVRILDIMTSRMDRIDVLLVLRKKDVITPFLLFIAKSYVSERIQGLDAREMIIYQNPSFFSTSYCRITM